MKRQRNRRARGRSRSAPAFDDHDSSFDSFQHNKADHKTAQLCRQVMRTLTMALADCGDDQVRELTVLEVAPAPDATRLMVTLAVRSIDEAEGIAGLLARLLAATPHLRREIASAITRKRVPELMFQVVRLSEGQP